MKTTYHENNSKKVQCTLRFGKMNGLATEWYDNGLKKYEGTLKDGKMDGLQRLWYRNGQKSTERTYKDDKLISEKEWDEDGNPKVSAPKPGVDTPPVVVEAPKVVVIPDQLEERDGLWYFEGKLFTGVAVRKFPDGQKALEATIKDGKPDGPQTMWYENGQKKSEETIKAGERISYKEWEEDDNPLGQDQDKLKERDGLWYFEEKPFTGVAVKKYDNGQKEMERTYRDGKRNGLETWWYENGQKKWETTYRDGKRDGLVTQWYDNGQKRGEWTLKDSKQISSKSWDKDGKRK